MATNEADTITAQAATTIDAPVEDVWNSVTDPDRISKYFMGADQATDWQVGHPITFTGEWKGQQYQDKGEILACYATEVSWRSRTGVRSAAPWRTCPTTITSYASPSTIEVPRRRSPWRSPTSTAP